MLGNSPSLESRRFSDQVEPAIATLRDALVRVFVALDVPVEIAQRSHRRLGIAKKLAWRLSKVVQNADAFAAARHVPGAQAMDLFLSRAADSGVPTAIIEETRAAADAFNSLVGSHAHNRRLFELLLSGHEGTETIEHTDRQHRKDTTTCLAYIWGVMARTKLATHVVHPASNSDDVVDIATVSGFVDLRWIRPGVSWTVKRSRLANDCGRPIGYTTEPIFETSDGVPLARGFCSPDLPPVKRTTLANGDVVDDVEGDTVGNASAITVIEAECLRAVPTHRKTRDNWLANHAVHVRTPCEALLIDLFIHRDIEVGSVPEIKIFGDIDIGSEMMPIAQRTRHRLMTWMRVEDLGTGLLRAYTTHVPRYTALLKQCMQRLSWDPLQFRMYRACVPYPVIPSTIALQYELSERGLGELPTSDAQ